jgi:hypothetical protein
LGKAADGPASANPDIANIAVRRSRLLSAASKQLWASSQNALISCRVAVPSKSKSSRAAAKDFGVRDFVAATFWRIADIGSGMASRMLLRKCLAECTSELKHVQDSGVKDRGLSDIHSGHKQCLPRLPMCSAAEKDAVYRTALGFAEARCAADAQVMMGVLCETGIGVRESGVSAMERGFESIYRDELKSQMLACVFQMSWYFFPA